MRPTVIIIIIIIIITIIIIETGQDQSKVQIGRAFIKRDIKLLFIACIVLVLQTMVLNTSLCFQKELYLAILVKYEL